MCTVLADKGLRLPRALEEGLLVCRPTQLVSQVAKLFPPVLACLSMGVLGEIIHCKPYRLWWNRRKDPAFSKGKQGFPLET